MTEPRFRRDPIRSKAIRQAAKGQRCTLNLPGICNYDPETVVLAHISDETRGGARKADDTSAMFACSACHLAFDERRTGLEPAVLSALVLRAYQRTVRRLVVMGVMQVPLDKPMEHRVKPRKPRDQRAPINNRKDWPAGRKLKGRNDLRRREREQERTPS